MKKIALPTVSGKLCAHFGHCEKFAIITLNGHQVVGEEMVNPPVHQPGLYPRWLHEMGVNAVIAGGMGQKAQTLFEQNGIKVYLGVQPRPARQAVEELMKNRLKTGDNLCDH